MEIKFTVHIQKANKGGTGIIYLPKEKRSFFNLGNRVQIRLFPDIYFFSKIIKYSRLGLYIPKNIVKTHKLLNKEVSVWVKKIRGFYAPVASDGRIYLPYDIVKSESLHRGDIIFIKAMDNHRVIYKKYSKVYTATRIKRNRKEFIYYLDKALSGRILEFQIGKLSQIPQDFVNPIVKKLLERMHYGFVDKDLAIIFRGNKVPAIINLNFKLSGLAFYLGAYFADGTRKGNSWAICASTFEQARYYLKMHKFLIKDSNPEFTISYTNINKTNSEKIKDQLAQIWENKTGIRINKFRIRKPKGKRFLKWNKYGTLIIKEHRQILLDFYNALLRLLVKEILLNKDKKLAIDFICGVMEGDGCAPAKKRGHIMVATNKKDVFTLKDIFKITQIKFKAVKEGKNKYGIRIGALEIVKNFYLLEDKLFTLYPKRRKALFERLKTVGAIKFLIEDRGSTNWVKVWLRSNGFVDKNYEITKNGLNLSNNLLNEMAKLGV